MNSELLRCRHPWAIARRNTALSAAQRSKPVQGLKPQDQVQEILAAAPVLLPGDRR